MTDPIAETRALLAGATPGPWRPCPQKSFVFGPHHEMIASESTRRDQRESGVEPGTVVLRGVGAGLPLEANHDLIVAAPRLLAALADKCERLKRENGQHMDFRAEVSAALPRPFGTTVYGAIEALKARAHPAESAPVSRADEGRGAFGHVSRADECQIEAEVCGKRCDHGSECLGLPGHSGGHETQHGCVFYDGGKP